MIRAYHIGLLLLPWLPACTVYHYADHLPGENVVFKDSGTGANGEAGEQQTGAAELSVLNSGAAQNPLEAKESDPHAPPAWTKKVAFDSIERGKQVYYGVGRFYYQAPTKKEVDKARGQADERAILELTKLVRSSTNITGELEGVIIQETWQDSAQMAIYSLARYILK